MPDLTLTEAEDGRHFTVHVGDAVTIRLAEDFATGYRWSVLVLDDRHVTVESRGYRSRDHVVDREGTAVWQLSARHVGTTRVALKRWRPLKPFDPADRRFVVQLDIVD